MPDADPEFIDTDDARQRLGIALRELRRDREWTQGDLAKRTGLSIATISAYEVARRKAPLEELVVICAAFDMLVTEFLDGLYPYGSRERK